MQVPAVTLNGLTFFFSTMSYAV